MSYTVYILRTSGNTLYIGQTNNLEKRLKEHCLKASRATKYLRAFTSIELVYKEVFPTRSEALKREWQLKQFSRAQKDKLIKI